MRNALFVLVSVLVCATVTCASAIGLVRNLSLKSDIKIGVISFNKKGELSQALTSDRDRVVGVLRDLPRSGSTNLAAGIHAALEELENNGVMGMTPSLG